MIRLATKQDVPRLLELGQEFHSKTPWKGSVLDLELAEQWILQHMNRSDRVVLIGDDGAIGAALAPPSPFGSSLYADETFWFAKGRSGVKLLSKLEAWCASRSAVLRLSTLSTSPPELFDFLKRRGYVKIQSTWELRK